MEQAENPKVGHACALIAFCALLEPNVPVHVGEAWLNPKEIIDLKEEAWGLELAMRRVWHAPCEPLGKEWPLPEILHDQFWRIAEKVDFVISGERPAQSTVVSFPERWGDAWRVACFGATSTA